MTARPARRLARRRRAPPRSARGWHGRRDDVIHAVRTDQLDALDHVAFEDGVDDVHAGDDRAEHGVDVIEPRRVDEVDEDLRVAGVAAARRDADRAAPVRAGRPRRACRTASPTYSLAPGLPPWIDEVRRDAVEGQAVVVALAGAAGDAQRRQRRDVDVEARCRRRRRPPCGSAATCRAARRRRPA